MVRSVFHHRKAEGEHVNGKMNVSEFDGATGLGVRLRRMERRMRASGLLRAGCVRHAPKRCDGAVSDVRDVFDLDSARSAFNAKPRTSADWAAAAICAVWIRAWRRVHQHFIDRSRFRSTRCR